MTEQEAWLALDGREFEGYVISLGVYPNRRPALTLVDPLEGPLGTFTVNMADHDVDEGEFHVPLKVQDFPPFARFRDWMIMEGIAEPTGATVDSGFCTPYAEVWRLAFADDADQEP